jgi:radical SAM protein with 4Fe4S-binding SPASM domain
MMPREVDNPSVSDRMKNGFVPSLVSWNITFRCNLHCAHCYMDAGSPNMENCELSHEEGRSLMDVLHQAGTRTLILSGGEPLLREDVLELVRYGTDIGLHMALGTNGTLIDHEMAHELKYAGIRKAAISLDSIYPYDHDIFRGKSGAWKKGVEGIQFCIEAGIPVQIHTTVTPFNYSDIESVLAFGEELGVRDFQLFFLVPTGRGKEIDDIVPSAYEQMIRDVLRYTIGRRISVRPTCAPQFVRIAQQIGMPFPPGIRGCVAGLSYCRIYPSGEVTPCPYLPMNLGSVRTQSFQEIWENAPVLQELRNFRLLEGKCGRCTYAEVCRGCRARAFGISITPREACGGMQRPDQGGRGYLGEDPSCSYQPEAV